MRVLIDETWTDGFLDAQTDEGKIRISVTALRRIDAVRDLYFERPKRVRAVLEYGRELGPRAVLRKVRSRQAERYRNSRHLVCGIGEVLTAGGAHSGRRVIFIGPTSPACAERLVVPISLTSWDHGLWPEPRQGYLLYADEPTTTHAIAKLAGWDPSSGDEPPADVIAAALGEAQQLLRAVDWSLARSLPLGDSEIRTHVPRRQAPSTRRPRAVLVGYGNYAKSTILPYVSHALDVAVIHEIDPLQIGPNPHGDVAWDTSGLPAEDCDVVLIAGHHHTHAPLATRSLRAGKAAIVEKPLVTTRAQLEELASALGGSGRLYPCFQRRYTRINSWIAEDFEPGPLDYHCIVFEEPLPRRHWYRWPVSGSRLISNGCHWIDHFLYLNHFSSPGASQVVSSRAGDVVNVSVELQNGAVFTMVLTDSGSRRVGMREQVQIRAQDRTATVVDGSRYIFESTAGRRRSRRVSKLDAYERMYRAISEATVSEAPGESVDRLRTGTALVLDLHEQLLGSLSKSAPGV